MNTSLTRFCKDNNLAKTTVYRRCQEMSIDTSQGLTPEAVEQLKHEFDLHTTPDTTTPVTPGEIVVSIGNHSMTRETPDLAGEYSLESLRTTDVACFDDPLAIAQSFIETADTLQAEMARDIRLRQQKLKQTQDAHQAIAAKAREFQLESRLYQERTELLALATNQESDRLAEALEILKKKSSQ